MSSCVGCNGVECARLEAMRVEMKRPMNVPVLLGGSMQGWQEIGLNVDVRWCLGRGRVEVVLLDPRRWAEALEAKIESAAPDGYR